MYAAGPITTGPPAGLAIPPAAQEQSSTLKEIKRMPNPSLLATHITIALALTITVGMQSAELARFRRGVPHLTAASTLPNRSPVDPCPGFADVC
jgi:hypothetical protein